MPQKRRSNVAEKGNDFSVAIPASVTNDVVGVLLAILSLALLVSLVAPSTAVVTHAVERLLSLSFGVGALLCPVTVFLLALTFFIEGEEPFGWRATCGLVLVGVSILALISLFVPGADVTPSVVLERATAESAGGYIGGALAWVLLNLVGRWVGLVLLVGLMVLGVIVCGFSVSAFVVRVREGAQDLSRVRASAREQRKQWAEESRRLAAAEAADEAPLQVAAPAVAPSPAATTFLGGRKTSVLTRGSSRRREARPVPAEFEEPIDMDDDPQMELPWQDEQEPRQKKTKRGAKAKGGSTQTMRAESQDNANATLRRRRKKKEAAPSEAQVTEDAVETEEIRFEQASEPQREQPLKRTAKRRKAAPAESAERQIQQKAAAGKRKAQDAAREAAGGTEVVVPDFLKAPSSKRGKAADAPRPGEGDDGYVLPSLSLLNVSPDESTSASTKQELDETRERLQGTLREFGLSSRVVDYVAGPIVTTFRIEMGEGERVSRIRGLEDDIALTLAAEKVRIFAPIPGTSYVGIEIPNATRKNVCLGDVLPHAAGGPLEVAIGCDSAGRPVVADIAKMPHMLVAGTTGSGKSVMINSMIMSLLMRTTPKQVRLIMIDPKRVEFSCYNGLPHLYVPVVTEPRQAASALQWAVSEMERRLRVFEKAGAREIKVYNKMCVTGKFEDQETAPEPMPYLVVIIDELSDLMMVAGKDVEASIVRIAQLARAAGIHLVIATQRPSANVVTGLIKSNIDNRIALKVSSGIDSRVILDETGAERLLGNGDMLFKYRGLNMQRVLGCYTSDAEINEVVDFIRAQAEPDYHTEILSAVIPGQASQGSAPVDEEDDPLVWEAAQIVVESRLGSTSGLQRRLKVGYARAGRIMDMLEAKGVVGPPDGSKPREVLLDEERLEELRLAEAKYREVV